MKKIVSLILATVMVLSMTVAASAAFVSSPSANAAPTLEEIKEGKTEDLVIEITAYKDRENLDEKGKAAIEDSHNDIKTAAGLVALVPELKAVAEKAKVKVEDLAVSDLFDISVTSGTLEDKITLVLGAETLKNFVALLHDKDGKWEVVEGAKVEGNKLTFSVNSLSPFAIVVNNSDDKDSPATGNPVDYGMIFVIGAVVFGGAAALCIARSKKRVND
ncbi:MAG: hypothetical protein IJ027_03620 [Oscillospiraceae bacterium]|nr:hypothetical protein [Oscillospiraceae bacterium]